ncbi:MAG TPA: aldo/keto reductase [bacterium]|jgi:predicted oxidoreductase|nr:aldo/keto reductase [bacterium]
MRTQTLGKSTLESSRLSYGCMRISGAWDPAEVTTDMERRGIQALLCALEAGYTLFDHADIYGGGLCESIYGKALKESAELKRRGLVATKCGIRWQGDPGPDAPHRYDFSYEHIVWSCEQSLRRLGVERIDLYQLHRPDFLADPAEIARAFALLHSQGKVRYFGVSNFSPSLLSAVQSACPMPLIVNQVEIHLGRLAPFEDGTLDQCLALGLTPLAYAPLAGGLLGDGGRPGHQDPRRDFWTGMLQTLDAMALALGVSRTVLSLAWLLKHPSKIIPIVGTIQPERIRDAARADDLDLSREDWYRLLLAARAKSLP